MASEPRHGLLERDVPRRDVLVVASSAFVAVGSAAALWPVIDSMNPAADVRAVAAVDVDVRPVRLGQRITVRWRGRPLFIVHRTEQEIERARADDSAPGLIEPARDAARAKRPEWLIVVGICTHLGCVPLGQAMHDQKSEYGGWFCPCHGSKYDTSGRVRRGPAPRNLEVPPYQFVGDGMVRIG